MKGGKKTRRMKKVAERQPEGMDRTRVWQVPEGRAEQRTWREPVTKSSMTDKGLVMMMIS